MEPWEYNEYHGVRTQEEIYRELENMINEIKYQRAQGIFCKDYIVSGYGKTLVPLIFELICPSHYERMLNQIRLVRSSLTIHLNSDKPVDISGGLIGKVFCLLSKLGANYE